MAPRKGVQKAAAKPTPRKPVRKAKPAAAKKLPAKVQKIRPQSARKGIFDKLVFVLSGDITHPHEKFERWITYHGGRVDKMIGEETTHLVCSMEDFKNKVKHVKDAWKIGKAKCKIVHVDFVDDCLPPAKKARLVPEKPYQLEKMLAKSRRDAKDLERRNVGFIKDIESSKELADPRLHCLFVDTTGFEHKVVLTRDSSNADDKAIQEKYTLYLYESRAAPHTYMVGAKFKKGYRPAVLYRDKCVAKTFEHAFAEFTNLFRKKTGVHWDQRLDGLKRDEQCFVYSPPTGGKPVGLAPHRVERAAEELRQNNDGVLGVGEGMVDGDFGEADPDLRDDTDSGDDVI